MADLSLSWEFFWPKGKKFKYLGFLGKTFQIQSGWPDPTQAKKMTQSGSKIFDPYPSLISAVNYKVSYQVLKTSYFHISLFTIFLSLMFYFYNIPVELLSPYISFLHLLCQKTDLHRVLVLYLFQLIHFNYFKLFKNPVPTDAFYLHQWGILSQRT